jgi:isoleucyl-tRNA synthetase
MGGTIDYSADQRIGPEILKGVADSYRRLRNTMRFMLGSLHDFTEAIALIPPICQNWNNGFCIVWRN